MWTPPHLKAGSWYLDCGKGFCPEEEEELKNTLDAADIASDSAAAALEDGNVDEDDLSHLNAKDKKKALAQKKADAEKSRKRLEKEAVNSGEKAKKNGSKSGKKDKKQLGKSTAKESESADEDTFHAFVNSLKRDSTFAGLSNLKLQQGTVSTLSNVGSSGVLVDELILNCSLLSIDQHYAIHNSFPKSWDSIIAFLEKVLSLSVLVSCLCIFLLPNTFMLSFGDGSSQLTCDFFDVSVPAQRRPPSTLLIGGQFGLWTGSHNL